MRYFLLNLFIFLASIGKAQYTEYSTFNISNGLPSNHIYQCVEDNKGFLWVATDAGVARFDGKSFQIFTTEHGLPDIDVIEIVKEKNGRIWVNCLRQNPAYFDEIKNRFINSNEDTSLKINQGSVGSFLVASKDSGVLYINGEGLYKIINKKVIKEIDYLNTQNIYIQKMEDGSEILFDLNRFQNRVTFFNKKKNEILDSLIIEIKLNGSAYFKFYDGKLYLFSNYKGKAYKFNNFSTNPLHFQIDSCEIPEPYNTSGNSKNMLYLIGVSNTIYEFDLATLELISNTTGNYLPNTIYNDSKGNKWVGTAGKGLLLYRNKKITTLQPLLGFEQNTFLSIAQNKGKIYAGSYSGQITEFSKNKYNIYTVIKKSPNRIRKILFQKNSIYSISEGGVYVNYSKEIYNSFLKFRAVGKTGIVYNDSIIIIGTTVGITHLNTKTQSVTASNRFKRIGVLEKTMNGLVYCGSTDGLYKYQFETQQYQSLAFLHPLLSQRIVGIATTPDSLIWIATSSNGIVILKNEKVIGVINNHDGIISNYANCIMACKVGQVWLGTHSGISIINYSTNKFQFKVQNITEKDGITNNVINDMVLYDDTVYAATDKGVSVIPANISIPNFNIPVFVTQIKINQRDTVITYKYELTKNQQNIFLQFAAVELSGHFKNLMYSLDGSNNWISLNENVLNLDLTHGNHILKVRAVDVNGNIGKTILTIQFIIATPFWEALWFWVLMALAVQIMALYFITRWQKNKRLKKMEKELANVKTASLEQQAFTSLMNPHFMFNALNSIQGFINQQDRQNANRYLTDFASLIRKNFEGAQESFIALEQELESIKIYLRLEQMRFTNQFTYAINIEESVDVDDWMIPSMMLQPIIENALLHGIMNSSLTGKLSIDISKQNDCLKIAITDNGIGIENSKKLYQNSLHKSRGMGLIVKRIKALNYFVKQPIQISFAEVVKDEKNPGNTTSILIPFDLYNAWMKTQQH